MTNWTTLTSASLGADEILTETTMQALYDNPTAMAERASGAPIVQPPGLEVKTSGTSASWTWPSGVTAIRLRLVGGGGGSGGTGRTNGGDTTVVYNSVTYTAGGGAYASSGGTAAGGTCTNCTLSVAGGSSYDTGAPSTGHGGSSVLGHGGGPGLAGSGYGGGGGPDTAGVDFGGGGGGAYGEVRIVKVTGQNTLTYTVGAGGTAGTSGFSGAPGVIIIEY